MDFGAITSMLAGLRSGGRLGAGFQGLKAAVRADGAALAMTEQAVQTAKQAAAPDRDAPRGTYLDIRA